MQPLKGKYGVKLNNGTLFVADIDNTNVKSVIYPDRVTNDFRPEMPEVSYSSMFPLFPGGTINFWTPAGVVQMNWASYDNGASLELTGTPGSGNEALQGTAKLTS